MSDTFFGRLGYVIGQLVLALLNATLILIVAALLLAWSLANTVERFTETAIAAATQQIEQLSPIADQAASLEDQLNEIRADIASLQVIEDSQLAQTAASLRVKVDDLDAGISEMNAALAPVIETAGAEPGILIDRAVRTGIAEAGAWITTLSGCQALVEPS